MHLKEFLTIVFVILVVIRWLGLHYGSMGMPTLQSILDKSQNGQVIVDIITSSGFKNPKLYRSITDRLCILVTFDKKPDNCIIEMQRLMLLEDKISLELQCKTLIVNSADLPQAVKTPHSPANANTHSKSSRNKTQSTSPKSAPKQPYSK